MVVYVGCDHGGLDLKHAVTERLTVLGHRAVDLGTYTEDSCDYPDYAFAVGRSVVSDPGSLGVAICKSGVGVSIAANKVKGVRCALCFNAEMGKLSREHNNANVLALGAGVTDTQTALDILDAFLSASFSGGRHARRVDKITAYEDGNE